MAWVALRLFRHLNENNHVKRVVGLPGDHVVCCDARGLLTVNDMVVKVLSFRPGDKTCDLTFDVQASAKRIKVGEIRSDLAQSRAHLGDPGGGMARIENVIDRSGMFYGPAGRAGIPRAHKSTAPSGLSGLLVSTVRERLS
jgi:signal peptidase I